MRTGPDGFWWDFGNPCPTCGNDGDNLLSMTELVDDIDDSEYVSVLNWCPNCGTLLIYHDRGNYCSKHVPNKAALP